jgi:hypothetical protein
VEQDIVPAHTNSGASHTGTTSTVRLTTANCCAESMILNSIVKLPGLVVSIPHVDTPTVLNSEV